MEVKEKRIKAVELAKLLSRKESDAFSAQLALHKRKSLLKLFTYIKKHMRVFVFSPETKQTAYKATFGTAFSPKKDYLLRNELRLLGIELVNFIILDSVRSKLAGNSPTEKKYLLDFLLDKKAHQLFETESQALIETATGQMDFEHAAALQQQAIEFAVYHKEATPDNFIALLKMLETYSAYAGSAFLHNFIYMQHKKAFTERTLQALGLLNTVNPLGHPKHDVERQAGTDIYLRYMLLLTESYRLHGTEKIKTLEAALKLIPLIHKKGFDKKASKTTALAGIGLEYFLMGDYPKAVFYHRHALTHADTLPPERVTALAFNYISALIRLENYPQAIQVMEQYREVWEKLPRMKDRFLCLKAMCHLFAGEHKKALGCIPDNRKQSGIDHYYYFRFIQVIALYQRGDLQLALNEADNFERTVRYQDKNKNYLLLTVLMKRFLNLRESKITISQKVYRQRAKALSDEFNAHEMEQKHPDKALLYKWVSREINEHAN